MVGSELSGIDLIIALDNKIRDLRTSSFDISFGELANKYRDNELIIQPDFQRLFRWSEAQQSRFIESLLLELPIPPFFLIENENGILELIDGLQRISSYLRFIGVLTNCEEPGLVLTECDIIPELNGIVYRDLPTALQLKLKNRYVRLEIVKRGSDSRLRYYMFKRLNTGGLSLSAQEMRNSTIRILNDRFNRFLIHLSGNEDFRVCISTLTEDKILEKYDQELVLRFFAFKNDKDKFRHDISDFMTEYMEAVSDPERDDVPFEYATEESAFEKTFRILKETLGEYSFSRVNEKGNYVLGFIVYHYEAFTLGIQRHLHDIDLLNPVQMERIAEEFAAIKRDPKFREITTGGGRNTQRYLDERIAFVDKRVEKVI
ncbi:Uncharacterised protein [uncultured archaeon]|nr:Uncharacterised protein [uncultured archaeon]